MMGKDCEALLSSIVKIENILTECISEMSVLLNTAVIIKADHNHGENNSKVEFEFEEKESESADATTAIVEIAKIAMESFGDDKGIMESLESNLYTDKTTFNNSIGSPWSEIHVLESSINNLSKLSSPGNYNGGNTGIAILMSVCLSECINAKWALIMYNDYIQRGFDYHKNSKTPSITHTKSDGKKSTGNIKQKFSENVNIPEESLDPF